VPPPSCSSRSSFLSAERYSGSIYPGAEKDLTAMLDRIDRSDDIQL
jgi:hypothetical protein